MILGDTDILSAFAKIDRLETLFKLLKIAELDIASGVFYEIEESFRQGRKYALKIFEMLAADRIRIVYLTSDEKIFCESLPISLGRGERESISIARERGAILLANESRVAHWCKQYKVLCVRLPAILRGLWTEGVLTKAEVQVLVTELQAKDRMQFKEATLTAIFADK